MPKITEEEAAARRTEIIDACEELYQSESYRDITMTQVGEIVSFGRANVYNYFQNKDEILLALLQREYERWVADLSALGEGSASLDGDGLADGLAKSVQARTQMLKILAMNLYDIEQNSRLESLVEFKSVYKQAVEALKAVVRSGKPSWSEELIDRFVYGFMPFMHGAYPHAFHSEKQRAAMDAAGVAQPDLSIYSLVRDLAAKLLQDGSGHETMDKEETAARKGC